MTTFSEALTAYNICAKAEGRGPRTVQWITSSVRYFSQFLNNPDIGAVTGNDLRRGLARCYPHKLRHTSSVAYLRNGGDPFSLQKKLGHSSLQMTRHYSNLADSDVRAAHLRNSPADRLRT